jgi:hypothetical protein
MEGATVEPTMEFEQLRLGFVDQIQWRYEVIHPLVLLADRTTRQRAQETHTHPETVRQLTRRFRQQSMRHSYPAMSRWYTGRGRARSLTRCGRRFIGPQHSTRTFI